MKKIIAIFIALIPFISDLSAKDRERETRIMGVPMSPRDTSSNGRRLAQRLFISKGRSDSVSHSLTLTLTATTASS